MITAQVAGQHPIRIILPPGYRDEPARRYPVLYFLHGSPDSPVNQNYPALRSSTSMITVIPDGGARGWYADWRDQNTAAGAQKWETFHLDQVIPFIDDNLRTVAAKRGRAVAGISMGGLGAMRYAQRHPELFTEVASMSGGLDLSGALAARDWLMHLRRHRVAVFGTRRELVAALGTYADRRLSGPLDSRTSPGTRRAICCGARALRWSSTRRPPPPVCLRRCAGSAWPRERWAS